jgi:histidyl-tRNA synthetase
LNLGGVDLPAVGFGMGDVVLGELLRERGKAPAIRPSIDVLVAGVTGEDAPHVLRLAHDLRDAGVRVEYSFKQDGLGKQLKLADARNAALAIVIGPDDRARGELQLKDLVGKSQRAVAATEVVGEVKRLVGAMSREP